MPRVTRSQKVAYSASDSKETDESSFPARVPKIADCTKNVEENVESIQNNPDNSGESDDDEAPESISLSASKEVAIAEIQSEKRNVDALKEKEKQRRRDKDDIFKTQKELRRARELSRLPADLLDKVASRQKTVAKQQKEIKGSTVIGNMHVAFDSDEDDEDDTLTDHNEGESAGLQVVVLNQVSKKKVLTSDSASEFVKNHFYGDRLKRVDSLKDVNQKRRRKWLGPAIKFTKKQ